MQNFMAVYDNNNADSVFTSIEFSDSGNIAVFRLRHELDIAAAKQILSDNHQTILAQADIEGDPILVIKPTESKDALLDNLSRSTGEAFALHQQKSRGSLDFIEAKGWKMRSFTSVTAQILQIGASLLPWFGWGKADAVEQGVKQPGDKAALLGFSLSNLGANLIIYLFGSEKKEDTLGFKRANDRIESEINRFLPDQDKLALPPDKSPGNLLKTRYMTPEELEKSKPNPLREALGNHSVLIGEIGLRVLGTFAMICSPDKWKKGIETFFSTGSIGKAYDISKVKDDVTRNSAFVIMFGKIIGIFAQAKDKLDPPKSWKEKFSQEAAWTGSSIVEFMGTMPLLANAVANKKAIIGGNFDKNEKGQTIYKGGGTVIMDPLSIAAQVFNASAYPVKIGLPKAEKEFDFREIQARHLTGLVKLQQHGQQDKIPEVLARITSDIIEQMGTKASFANLYAETVDKLEKYHGISLISNSITSASASVALANDSPAQLSGDIRANNIKPFMRGITPTSIRPKVPASSFQDAMEMQNNELVKSR